MAKKEVKQWITVKGVHIPIFEGQSKEEAVKAALEKRKSAGPISKATRGKKIAEHTKKTTEYASAIAKRELAEKNYKNAKKSGSEDRINTMDRALDYAKDREKQKHREVVKAYNRADEAREKKAYEEVKFGKSGKQGQITHYSDIKQVPKKLKPGEQYALYLKKGKVPNDGSKFAGQSYNAEYQGKGTYGVSNPKNMSPVAGFKTYEAMKKAYEERSKLPGQSYEIAIIKEPSNNAQENTFQNRQALKNEIDAYVKAHPNPNAEDRKKVSEMRDRYNAMLKESTAKTKAKVNAQLAEERKQEAKKKELEELKREHYKLYKHDEDNIPGRDEKLNALEKKINALEKKSAPAVNASGTMTPDQLAKAEKKRDALYNKQDHGSLNDNEKKELNQLENSISGHYQSKKDAGKSSAPEFKSRQEAEEYYRNKFAGVSSTYANKMAKKLGVEGRGKDKREALAKAYADKWETSHNISNNEAEKEKQIARNDAERMQAEKMQRVQGLRKQLQNATTDYEKQRLKGQLDAAERMANGGHTFAESQKQVRADALKKLRQGEISGPIITEGMDRKQISQLKQQVYKAGDKAGKVYGVQEGSTNVNGQYRKALFVSEMKETGKPKVKETSSPEKAISTLNDLKKQAWQVGKDKGHADKVRDEIKRIGEELPDGTVIARVKQNTSTQYTSQGAIQSQNTEIYKLYKVNGKWARYKDGSGETDFAQSIVYNSGELQTLEQAEKRAAELKKGDYVQTKGYGVKEKWQPTDEERKAAIAAERAGGLSLEDAERKVDRMSPAQVRKLAGTQSTPKVKKIPASQVTISDSQYRFSTGKAPKGYGNWAFYIGDSDEPVFFHGSYAEAKKKAIKEAANRGVNKIRVGS